MTSDESCLTDSGGGDLFVFRTGAEAMDNQVVLGSVGFGPNGYESARLIIVLGHEQCGAVIAAIAAIQSGAVLPGRTGDRVILPPDRPVRRSQVRQLAGSGPSSLACRASCRSSWGARIPGRVRTAGAY